VSRQRPGRDSLLPVTTGICRGWQFTVNEQATFGPTAPTMDGPPSARHELPGRPSVGYRRVQQPPFTVHSLRSASGGAIPPVACSGRSGYAQTAWFQTSTAHRWGDIGALTVDRERRYDVSLYTPVVLRLNHAQGVADARRQVSDRNRNTPPAPKGLSRHGAPIHPTASNLRFPDAGSAPPAGLFTRARVPPVLPMTCRGHLTRASPQRGFMRRGCHQ